MLVQLTDDQFYTIVILYRIVSKKKNRKTFSRMQTKMFTGARMKLHKPVAYGAQRVLVG